MRRALPALGLLLSAGMAAAEADVLSARYDEPTTRYAHGVLGDDVEWGALVLTIDLCPACARVDRQEVVIRMHESRVFEDTAPRLVDVDGDGLNEVLVVESHRAKGARVAIYDGEGLEAYSRYIGQAYRWMAPVGAADFDGDGVVEIAVVDRPHLAKTLTLWRYQPGIMPFVAELRGLTNHRIGEDYISGGVRDCGAGPEMIMADAGWGRIVSVTWDDGKLAARAVAPFDGRDSFKPVMSCQTR